MIRKIGAIAGLIMMIGLLYSGSSLGQVQAEGSDASGDSMAVKDALVSLGLTEFSQFLEDAGQVDLLDGKGVLEFPAGSFVIFAPDDAAFDEASGIGIDINALKEEPQKQKRLLLHHMVWDCCSSGDISQFGSVRSIQGENLSIEGSEGSILRVNGANVTGSMRFKNGIIYVIDRLLPPATDSNQGVVETAKALGAKKFADAVASSGLADTLNGQGLMGIEGLTSGPYTVFAPSDEAFASAKASVDSIGKKQGGMLNLLSYHVVDAEGLLNMTESSSIKSMLGDSLAVDVNQSLVGGAYVLRSERYDNGIVYVIDQVLVPISLSM